jgi:hypothetical protein
LVNKNKITLRLISIYRCLGLCNPSYCKQKCIEWMTSGRQQQINRKLLESNDNQIRTFITQNVIRNQFNQWEYRLDWLIVCPKLFFNTIGHKNSLKSLHSIEFNAKIKQFFEYFSPQYSHYRRKQCPNRRYISAKHELNPFLCYLKFWEKMNFLPKYKNKIIGI